MASAKGPTIEVTVKTRTLCPHSMRERAEAAKIRGICPLCFVDEMKSRLKNEISPMALPGPIELGLPEPPKPPLVIKRTSFFSEVETEESKLNSARWDGEMFMYRRFMDALYPKTRANPKQEAERG